MITTVNYHCIFKFIFALVSQNSFPQKVTESHNFNPFTPKYSEWYSPGLDLEHTIQVCWGENVKKWTLKSNNLKIISFIWHYMISLCL